MYTLALTLLALTSAGILIYENRRTDGILQYPTLMTLVVLGWVLPQVLGLSGSSTLPQGAIGKFTLMTFFCMVGMFFGYRTNRKSARMLSWDYNYTKLSYCALVLIVLGAFFYFRVGQMTADANSRFGGAWTGIITIYVFFAHMVHVGFALAVVVHARSPSLLTLSLIIFAGMLYLQRIIIFGRRSVLVDFLVIVGLALFYSRKYVPPRLVVLLGATMVVFLVNSAGQYRNVMLADHGSAWSGAGISDVLSIDFFGQIRDIAAGEGAAQEVQNASVIIESVDRTKDFDYGMSLWNSFIRLYIPGQLVGFELKNSLITGSVEDAYSHFGYLAHPGSTRTGIADAFASFWYFGALKFFLIGLIMSRWHRAALVGSLTAQLVVMLAMGDALLAVTHTTNHFFLTFVQLSAFLLPALVLSRKTSFSS